MSDNYTYTTKSQHYFSAQRDDIIAHIPKGPHKILEVGCGTGNTLVKLKESDRAIETVGIDIIDREPLHDSLDMYIKCDIEKLDLEYPPDYFDIIVFPDVLEHLVNPWHVVKSLSRYLAPGGLMIASIPNIREYKSLGRILFGGDFRYSQQGIFDTTHLRFFCRKNILELFAEQGFKIETIDTKLRRVRKLFNLLTMGLFEQFLVKQYLIVSRKC